MIVQTYRALQPEIFKDVQMKMAMDGLMNTAVGILRFL
jgi:hypothetical protein